MKLNKNFKNNIFIIFIILFIFSYHFFIQNGLEKTFFETYFHYETVKRPSNIYNNNELKDINNEKYRESVQNIEILISKLILIKIQMFISKFVQSWVN